MKIGGGSLLALLLLLDLATAIAFYAVVAVFGGRGAALMAAFLAFGFSLGAATRGFRRGSSLGLITGERDASGEE